MNDSTRVESIIAAVEYDRTVGSDAPTGDSDLVTLYADEWEQVKSAALAYDSRPDTFRHSLRVGELMAQTIAELADRSVKHDLSKTEPPEVEVFDEYTPKLKHSTYGSDEYQSFLAGMGEGLAHHYAHNRHHPEHFGENGINGMTLVDLIEMLADWKAATERHDNGSLFRSLTIQAERFGISDQLGQILANTARHFGWLDE